MKILVTGATGTIGSAVLRLLVDAGCSVRAMIRQPDRIQLAGIETAYGDFEDAGSLVTALENVQAVFLATPGSASPGQHPGSAIPRHDYAMISEARKAGVRKIVKLSSFGTGLNFVPPLGDWHGPGEYALRMSGMAWTFLRPVAFASNAVRWIPSIRASGEVRSSTGAGRQAVVDPRDVAAVASHALRSGEHDGKAYTLTGPELLSVADQVGMLTRVLQRPIRVIDDTPERTREGLMAAGFDLEAVGFMMAGIEVVRAGRAEIISDDVRRVTGRSPVSFDRWARDNLAQFS
jgi:uncharacterized protein YbjT (DUF2867 family)